MASALLGLLRLLVRLSLAQHMPLLADHLHLHMGGME